MHRFQSLLAAITLLSSPVLASEARAQANEPLEIVAFGDSLSAGYGLQPGEGFAEQLEAALRREGRNVTVVNAGVSGDTTAAGLARLDWSVPETADLVIVELGANDALRGVSPEIARRNLDAILARLKEKQLPVLLAGMYSPPNMGPDYASEFNAIYPALAKRYGVPLYPFFLDGVVGNRALNLSDGMHPNAEGISRIVERILPAVSRELDRIRSRKAA